MKNIVQYGMIIVILCSGMFSVQRESLYDSIDYYLKKHRQSIERDDVIVQDGKIRIELVGRRTNLKSLFLMGFYSVGRTLYKSSYPFKEVQVVIHYEMKGEQQVSATVSVEKVLELAQNRLSSEQFMYEIEY